MKLVRFTVAALVLIVVTATAAVAQQVILARPPSLI